MAFFSALLVDRVEGIAVADSHSYVTLFFSFTVKVFGYQTKISFPGSSTQTCRGPKLGGTIEIMWSGPLLCR